MVADCVFCRIVSGDIPSERLLEDKRCIVIRDINPQAPQHLLVVTKAHIPTVADVRVMPEALAESYQKLKGKF